MGVLASIDSDTQGVIPSSLECLFRELNSRNLLSFSVHLSFYQIYQEQISDLLNPENKNMAIREESGEVYIHDLIEV
jgi:kinesin family protein 15